MKKLLIMLVLALPLFSKSIDFTAVCTPKAFVNTKSGESYLVTPKEAKIKYLKVDKNVVYYDGQVYRGNDKFCLWECNEKVNLNNIHVYKRDKDLFVDELFADDAYKLGIYKCKVKPLPVVKKKTTTTKSERNLKDSKSFNTKKIKDKEPTLKKSENASEETIIGDGKYPIKDETFPPDVAWKSVIDIANPELADKLRAEQTEKEIAEAKKLKEEELAEKKKDEELTNKMIKQNAKHNHDEGFFEKIKEMF